jgi:hypothetical protein
MTTTSLVLLLGTAFVGLPLVWFLRMPKDWDPYNPPWNHAHRKQFAFTLRLLVAVAFGAFLISILAPSLLPR